MEHYRPPAIEIICYTAGILDGEGSIYLVQEDNRFGFSISQSHKNDGEALCRWLCEQWGCGNITVQTRGWNADNPQWHWSVAAAYQVQHILQCLLPYLRVKRRAAERALAHIDQRIASGVRFFLSAGEDQYIIDHSQESNGAIATALKRSRTAIREARERLGLPPSTYVNTSRAWTPEDKRYLLDHWRDTDDDTLGAALERSDKSIQHKRLKLGLLRE
jgi:hypothetical protein